MRSSIPLVQPGESTRIRPPGSITHRIRSLINFRACADCTDIATREFPDCRKWLILIYEKELRSVILTGRSRAGICNFGPDGRTRRTESAAEGGGERGGERDTRKGRNCGEVPRGLAINADCAALPRDEGRDERRSCGQNGVGEKRRERRDRYIKGDRKTEREREEGRARKGSLIAEILEVN